MEWPPPATSALLLAISRCRSRSPSNGSGSSNNSNRPSAALYNLPGSARICRAARPSRRCESRSGEIVRRHEALRTCFVAQDGAPVQGRSRAVSAACSTAGHRPVGQSAGSEQRSEAGGRRGGPRGRSTSRPSRSCGASSCAAVAADHTLVVNLHHAVSDGWSMGVFLHELASLYEAFRVAGPSPLPEPAIRYTDFARWHRRLGSTGASAGRPARFLEGPRFAGPAAALLATAHRPPAAAGAELQGGAREGAPPQGRRRCRGPGLGRRRGVDARS